jgi:hypothetical protein
VSGIRSSPTGHSVLDDELAPEYTQAGLRLPTRDGSLVTPNSLADKNLPSSSR